MFRKNQNKTVKGRVLVQVCGAFAGMLLLFGFPMGTHAENAVPESRHPPGWEEVQSMSKWVIPAQSRGWVGVQGGERDKPMEVTPGNRFLRILGSHAHWYFDRQNGLGLSDNQKRRVIQVLIQTRDRLVGLDAKDLFLVQRFEAAVATPSVDVARLGRLNERIGEIEGEEGGIFMGALEALQRVLLPGQRKIAVAKGHTEIPPLSVDLSSAVFFADRILAIRWNRLQSGFTADGGSAETKALASYENGRKAILALGMEKTAWDKKAGDLLSRPVVDLESLGAVEKKAGPIEGQFWETLIRVVGSLNPSSLR
ncbi:MAG: hypothetical protein ACYCYP_11695 [Leptospirales bacterium]